MPRFTVQKLVYAFCDNQSALKSVKKNYVTKKSRYIKVRCHKIKNSQRKGAHVIQYVKSELNADDLCMKLFSEFQRQVNRLMDKSPLVPKNGQVLH